MPRGKKPAPGKALAKSARLFERLAAAGAEFQKPAALPLAVEPA